MKEGAFFGREEEARVLRQGNWRGKAELIAVYGRRRVGKTALVEHALSDHVIWKFEGVEGASKRVQIRFFLRQLALYTHHNKGYAANDWDDVFRTLDDELQKRGASTPTIVFLDEFQWMCEMKPHLISIFKFFWDNFLSKHAACKFIICGSVSSFIVKKVLTSAALYGRVDREIELLPLRLPESRGFFSGDRPFSHILEAHMILGGVPQYLLELDPDLSIVQNLNEYAFRQNGFFAREFGRLFISHFARHPAYETILRVLAEGAKRSLSDLARKCRCKPGGTFSDRLADLELAGFIKGLAPINKKQKGSKLSVYTLDDEFLHFYFSFIQPNIPEIAEGSISVRSFDKGNRWAQWRGYAFERFCRKHARHIAHALQFGGIDYRAGAWIKRPDSGGAGAQVDLLFLRSDKVITLCETKCRTHLNAASVGRSIQEKVRTLSAEFPGYAIQTVMLLSEPPAKPGALLPHVDRILTAESVFGES